MPSGWKRERTTPDWATCRNASALFPGSSPTRLCDGRDGEPGGKEQLLVFHDARGPAAQGVERFAFGAVGDEEVSACEERGQARARRDLLELGRRVDHVGFLQRVADLDRGPARQHLDEHVGFVGGRLLHVRDHPGGSDREWSEERGDADQCGEVALVPAHELRTPRRRPAAQSCHPAALRSTQVGQIGYRDGSRVGTHFLPHSATMASPVTYARATSSLRQ